MEDFDDDLIDDDIVEETSGTTDGDGTATDEDVTSTSQRLEEASDQLHERIDSIRGVEWLGLTKAGLYGILLLPLILLTPIVRVFPLAWKIYHKLHLWSAWQMQKAASADAIANVRHPNDKEDVRPAAFVEGGEDDRERTGWKVKGIDGKRYAPSVRGGSTSRLGKADLIHINEDDLEQGTWVESVMDSALQFDRERYLFRDADVTETTEVLPVDPSLGNGQTPVADGGFDAAGNDNLSYQPVSRRISIDSPGIHEDTLVPLTSRTGYDGQLVSFEQYRHLKNSQADQETVRDAKNAGWMAAKLDDIGKGDLIKWAIIIGVGGLILLFHQDLGAAISSFGGGGGAGSVAPTGGLGLIPLIKTRLGGE